MNTMVRLSMVKFLNDIDLLTKYDATPNHKFAVRDTWKGKNAGLHRVAKIEVDAEDGHIIASTISTEESDRFLRNRVKAILEERYPQCYLRNN